MVWLAAALVSCGGGGDGADAARSGRETAADVTPPPSFFPNVPIPADAGTRGMWSPVYNWPGVSVHAVVLPDGRVLTFGSNLTGQQGAFSNYDIWDSSVAPDSGHLTLPNGTGTDIFCSSSVLLPPESAGAASSVFIAGGDVWTGTQTVNGPNQNSNLLDVATGALSRRSNMLRPRWYSTSTTLINGETYIQGGVGGEDRPEVRSLTGSFRLLTGANTSSLNYSFPRNFVAPDGRIFGYDTNGQMYYVNASGSGALSLAGLLPAQYASDSGSAAMFRPGRILQLGGNSNGVVIIDVTGAGNPVLTPTQSLSSQRQWVNATVLADGKVLATSGSQVRSELVGVNSKAEIWDPTSGQWMQGPQAARPRLYHSNAVMLPDGSVLVTGGGATEPLGTGPADNLNSEIYYPPYIFTPTGQRAPRPIIASAPSWVDIGSVFAVGVANVAGVSRVTMVKTGASTHSFNMDQRFLDLTFSASGSNLSVQAPSRAADATPGYYMLFVFNEAGVPSIAKIVRIGIAPVSNPATVPSLANPGSQAHDAGSTVSLALVGSDPNGDILTYGSTGLPPGLSISPGTGLISGVPVTAGNYNVVVTASDGINVASASFVWTVRSSNGVVIDPLPPVAATQAATATTFTASAQGGSNVLYRWNFGDGSGDTPWSDSPTVSHSFANPGTYSVTLSVSDDSGVVLTRSFLQTVYLPATASRPSASTNILVQTPASGNTRLWVVNQDNDSVSVFDALTLTRQAEIAVGADPRSIAQAPNGLIWVTNKRSDSISVIDPVSNAVVATLPMQRGSRPFGLAMSPAGGSAFVVLESAGQLVRLDATTYAQTGVAAVGANPRQVSVSADGSTVYVSRFITPALPGEGTATVTPTPSYGGEVVVLSGGGMSLLRTIVLQHSERADLENQGRGIPNYLGAVAISPDGTQAWVPSKQDNVRRGALRDGLGLNFQNTVRAISSRIVLGTQAEDLSKRVDHDNASMASAAAYDSRGVYLFVALETSREVAVVDAHGGFQVMRFAVGRAPQGLALSADGNTLYVNNFMDRTVGAYDLRPLLTQGLLSMPLMATSSAVSVEKLTPTVLLGKQHFYDARDTRLARDRYLSCASCHNDGGSDGRTWDFTGQGEGLRNTIALRGRAGAQGLLHWSANFDEVQDFEGQIRTLAGGTGLMSDVSFAAGTRSQPLGDPKAGVSGDLDALAAYVQSLTAFEPSPLRDPSSALSATAVAGRSVFVAQGCGNCHGGNGFTYAGATGPRDIGTIKLSSGKRLGGPLTAIDIPTLRDVWQTAPYLHDGSAATLEEAVLAHSAVSINAADLTTLVRYLREIGADEPAPPGAPLPTGLAAALPFNEGGGVSSVDLTGNNHGAGLLNGAAWVVGKYGSAIGFDGVDDAVSIANASTLNLGTSNFTVMMWIKRNALGGSSQRHLFSKCHATLWQSGCKELYFAGDVLRFGSYASGDTNSVSIADTNWHHIALVFTRATNTTQIYVDGTLRTTATKNLEADSATHVVVVGNQGGANPFSGSIDELRVYSQALTAAQVVNDMNTPLAPVADTTPPVLSNAQPSGVLAAGTTQATLSLSSSENATCRYATTAGTAYGSMTNTFSATGGTAHSTVVSGLANGQSYSYYVRCQDAAGNSNTSDLAIGFSVATPDTTVPAVSISAPAAGATVTGTVSVSASASDNVGVVGVQFLLDGVNLDVEDTVAPYTVSWNTASASNGAHTLSARARDAAGNQTTSAVVDVTVSNTAPDTTPPLLSGALPSGVLAAGTTQTTLSVTSNENATCRYATTAGTTYGSMPNTFSTTGGTAHSSLITGLVGGQNYNYYVRCQDAALNANTADVVISFSVPDSTAPTVSISAPAAGATVTGAVTVSASASDNVGVVGVQFLLDGVNLGAEDTVSPYTVSWNTASATNGAHTLSARARDAAGNQTTSVGISVTVSNAVPDTTPPTVTVTSPANGATGVSGTANVTATFSEAIDATTINSTTFELRDAANTLVAAAVTYNATTRVATLNPTPTLTQAAVYTATVRGGSTDPRVKDTAGNALVANMTWSFTIAPDVTPPTVTSTSPASGATGVGRNANVTATFSEAMDAATISTSTVELRDPTNAVVPAVVTYNATSRVVTLNPTLTLIAATTYTATVKGGAIDPRVKDAAGNALATNKIWTFTTR